jgi:8-oxo-dGTP diphosphatase
VRWLGPDDLDDVDWLPADRILLPAFRALLT